MSLEIHAKGIEKSAQNDMNVIGALRELQSKLEKLEKKIERIEDRILDNALPPPNPNNTNIASIEHDKSRSDGGA
ncbi:MAG: hypothetical protein GXP60_05135 [Epsilonproteobacteria bacterium]|nr:hypothetical protein [Campylobacterota bacterium]